MYKMIIFVFYCNVKTIVLYIFHKEYQNESAWCRCMFLLNRITLRMKSISGAMPALCTL